MFYDESVRRLVSFIQSHDGIGKKDELKELDTELDKLYGKGNFPMAHAYIEGLLKNN